MKRFSFLIIFIVTVFSLVSWMKKIENDSLFKKSTIVFQDQIVSGSKKSEFKYQPIKPINGKLKGVVELGASGFNSFIINVDADKNWEIKHKEYGNSFIAESATNALEIQSKLKKYIQNIIDFGVEADQIHFVISSGAAKVNITKNIKAALNKMGYVVNDVTAEQEAQYALKAVLPQKYEQTAFVIDIGSGNTKISYVNEDKIIGLETYGAKYFLKNIEDKIVYDDVYTRTKTLPKQRLIQSFIIGGVPYQMAKSLRKGNERYTVLNKDISTYEEVVGKKGKKVACGLNIFKAINDASHTNAVVFDWDANFTIGFLLELPY